MYTIKRILLLIAGSILLAFTINVFVRPGGIIPGGFNGLTLLIQELALHYFAVNIPFSVILYTLNAVPAIFCFKYVGRKFTLYSCLSVVICGFLIDWMPQFGISSNLIHAIELHDILLASVFGGIINAVAIALCLYADATSGGTDFIAIFISEKYRHDAWNYILAGNCVILILAVYLFSIERALYSIIFQFTTTVSLTALYKAYQQKTLLIITNKPEEIYVFIRDKTHHGATAFDGIGEYEKKQRTLLYSVVSASEVTYLINGIRKIDESAFINVVKTEQINGRFFHRSKD